MPLRGSQRDQIDVLASRNVGGVPLSKEVIEGSQSIPSSDDGRFTMGRHGRQPPPRAGMLAGREAAQPVVNARSLGAKPDGAQGSSLIRIFQTVAPRGEIKDPSERSIFQPRNAQGSSGARTQPLEDMHEIQRHSTRTPRAENAGQASQTGFSRGPISFQARTQRGGDRPPQRRRGGGLRDSQKSDQSKRQRRGGGGRDRGERSLPKPIKWTEDELQYLKEKATLVSPQPLEYVPVEISRGTFTGMGPATASDEWSMSEMLGERLLLAKKYLDRQYVQWVSKEQKADVMAVVVKLKAIRRVKSMNGGEKEANEATSVSAGGDQQAQALMLKLLGGSYEKFKRPQQGDILGQVERYVHRNDSYYPKDEMSILKKVESILPTEQASRTTRHVRKDVMA